MIEEKTFRVEKELTIDGDVPQSEWTRGDWLSYYTQCREFQGGLAERFTAFITQASVFAAASCAVLTGLEKTAIIWAPAYLCLGIATSLPLFIYWRLLIAYYNQIKTVGDVLVEIEKQYLRIPSSAALLQELRSHASFYGTAWGRFTVWCYPGLLIASVFITAYLLYAQRIPVSQIPLSQ